MLFGKPTYDSVDHFIFSEHGPAVGHHFNRFLACHGFGYIKRV